MQEQEQEQIHSSSRCLLIIVLLLLVLVAAILYALSRLGGSGGLGYSFEQQEAFRLAQETQAYRQAHPYGGNYGRGSITVQYADGTSRRYPSPISQGYDAPNPPIYRTHSEQKIDRWLRAELTRLRQQHVFDKATAIRIVIFSQVIVCPQCRTAMIRWQRQYRALAATTALFVTVWQLTPGKAGFNPKVTPQGKPVPDPTDVQQVKIPFAR
jgi:hypothetical protein